jgi:hypothetical protein
MGIRLLNFKCYRNIVILGEKHHQNTCYRPIIGGDVVIAVPYSVVGSSKIKIRATQ